MSAGAAGGPVIGVDVGGTKLLPLRLEPDGSIVAGAARPSPRAGADLVSEIVASVEALTVAPGAGAPAALGVGVPALVDAGGVVRFSAHLGGVVGTALRDELEAALPGTAVWVGNDATAACWAEHQRGAARGCQDVLLITLGTGIGAGFVSGGRLLEGAHGYAGEVGHMVIDPTGPHCSCGKRGCWERYASGSGLGVLGREMAMAGLAPRLVELAGGDPEAVRGEHVTRAAGEGDPAAIETMGRLAGWLALGLSNLVNALDPEVIVVGGGLAEAGDVLIRPTREAFDALVEARSERAGLRVELATLGHRAGAVGAGLLAERRLAAPAS